MTIEEIMQLSETPQEMISELRKGRDIELPEIKKYVDAINPKKHLIFDETKRPNNVTITGEHTYFGVFVTGWIRKTKMFHVFHLTMTSQRKQQK